MSEQIIVFLDPLGRTIIGTFIEENDQKVMVKNPAVLHAGLSEDGKIKVNLIPVFFREFLKDWNAPIIFDYVKSSIVRDGNFIVLEDKLVSQYNSMWTQRPSRDEVRKNAAAVATTTKELKPTELKPTETVQKLDLFTQVPSTAKE